tara:strand:+ start:942 stop:1157 length:216 start_codon:yes stop_codon:yes gene_type:complete
MFHANVEGREDYRRNYHVDVIGKTKVGCMVFNTYHAHNNKDNVWDQDETLASSETQNVSVSQEQKKESSHM